MIQCLYKDLRLAAHPTLYIFILLGALVIVPSYPYSLVFFFGCLAPFITMMYGRETNDIYYMALLPIEKKEKLSLQSAFYLRLHNLVNCYFRFLLQFYMLFISHKAMW